jgi:hypothetical protein
MIQAERIWDFLQRLTPQTRSFLLSELERLETCGVDVPGSADIQARLRTEFRKDGSPVNRTSPSRYFFAPLEALLVDGAPEHANSGRIARSSVGPIWEWISRDLLPTMARDYNAQMKDLIAADKQREIQQAASVFQTKVTKSLEGVLASPEGAAQVRAKLAAYTASPAAYGDVTKIMGALRAREALAKFDSALPAGIAKFDDPQVAKITALLDTFRTKNAPAVPFALALLAKRLKTPWQLIRLATKAARSKKAADVAATPYGISVSMVLDQLEDKRLALRMALTTGSSTPASCWSKSTTPNTHCRSGSTSSRSPNGARACAPSRKPLRRWSKPRSAGFLARSGTFLIRAACAAIIRCPAA